LFLLKNRNYEITRGLIKRKLAAELEKGDKFFI